MAGCASRHTDPSHRQTQMDARRTTSKQYFQSNLSGTISGLLRGHTERGGVDTGPRSRPDRMIEDVERLQAKLSANTFSDAEVLKQRRVPHVGLGSAQIRRIRTGVAEDKRGRLRKN